MAEAEFDQAQKLTDQEGFTEQNGTSTSEPISGDPMEVPEDLRVDDLAGPTIEEDVDTPLESAEAGGPESPQMQKKTMPSPAGKTDGVTPSSPTVKKVCWEHVFILFGIL